MKRYLTALFSAALFFCAGCLPDIPEPTLTGREKVCLYANGEPRSCVCIHALGPEGKRDVGLLLHHAMKHGSFTFSSYAPQILVSSGRWTLNIWEDRVIVCRLKADGTAHWVQGVAALNGEEKVLAARIREKINRFGPNPRNPHTDPDSPLYFGE